MSPVIYPLKIGDKVGFFRSDGVYDQGRICRVRNNDYIVQFKDRDGSISYKCYEYGDIFIKKKNNFSGRFLRRFSSPSKLDSDSRGRLYTEEFHRSTANLMEGPPLDPPETPHLPVQTPDPLTIMDRVIYRSYIDENFVKGIILSFIRLLMNRSVLYGIVKCIAVSYIFLIIYTGIMETFSGYMAFKIKSLRDFYEMKYFSCLGENQKAYYFTSNCDHFKNSEGDIYMQALKSFVWQTAMIGGGSLTNFGFGAVFIIFFVIFLINFSEYFKNKYLN